jgi:hypothetical protein
MELLLRFNIRSLPDCVLVVDNKVPKLHVNIDAGLLSFAASIFFNIFVCSLNCVYFLNCIWSSAHE